MTDQTIRVLEQAVGIAKQRIVMLEEEKSNLLRNLDMRRALYAELEKSEEFWHDECASEKRKAATSIIFMFIAFILAAAAITKAILVCQ